MTQSVRPFLMFVGEAEAAMRLYASLLPEARILELERYGPEGPGPEGKVSRGLFTVGGQTVMCFDSPIPHPFGFTPATSFFVDCQSDAELERLAGGLSEGGQTLMPLGDYGFSRRFAWVSDRFGVSWQLNLA